MNMFERHEMTLAHHARIDAQKEVKRLLAVVRVGLPAAIIGGFILGALAALLWRG